MSLSEVLPSLTKVTQTGPRSWRACCPAHDDATPSLTITECDGGKVLWHCHAGCSQPAVQAALGIEPQRAERGPYHLAKIGEPTRTWTYRATDGRTLGVVARYETGAGKEFRFWQPDGSCKALPQPRPLYHLDQLAARPTAMVLVCEGEKAADAAGRLFPDMVATTWPGGAKAVGKADLAPLKGREILLWPDHDAPGQAAMLVVQRAVGGRLLEPPADKPKGWDAADATEEEARQLLKVAEPAHLVELRASLIADLEAGPEAIDAAEPPKFVVHELLPVAGANLAGAGGVSKTTLALVEAVHIVNGGNLYGHDVLMQGPAIHIIAEDGAGYGRYQLQRLLADGQACGALPGNVVARAKRDVHVVGWSRSRFGPLVLVDREGNVHRAPAFDLLLEVLAAYRPVYVTLDPSVLLGPGEDRGNSVDGVWADMVGEAARELCACMQLIDHVSQAVARTQIVDQHAARGGTAKTDNARLARQLVRYAAGDGAPELPSLVTSEDLERRRVLQLHWTKSNYAALPPFAWLRRRGHWIEYLRTVNAEEAADRARAAVERQKADDVAAVVRTVTEGLARGEQWSRSQLAEDIGATDSAGAAMSRQRVKAAIQRALTCGELLLRDLPPGAERVGRRRNYLSTPGAAS